MDAASKRRRNQLWAAIGVVLVACAVLILLLLVRKSKDDNARMRSLIESIPAPHISGIQPLDTARYASFLYASAQCDPVIVSELQRLDGRQGWHLDSPLHALDELQSSYPGWFNPAYVSTAPISIRSSDGRTEAWAFNDGKVLLRTRVKFGSGGGVKAPAAGPPPRPRPP
jgi:hypothetical protein